MAIIVSMNNGDYQKIKSGNGIVVQDNGALLIQKDSWTIAAIAPGTWVDALNEGDYEPVNWQGKPIQ